MVIKGVISGNMKRLNSLYNSTTKVQDQLFYSKLCILELCGWLEESIDQQFMKFAGKHLKDQSHIRLMKEKVKHTHGFDYQNHFRSLWIQLIGIVNYEIVEKRMDPKKLALFISSLQSLKKLRDPQAHTHIRGATSSINAPSVTIGYFPALYEGLIDFESALKTLRF